MGTAAGELIVVVNETLSIRSPPPVFPRPRGSNDKIDWAEVAVNVCVKCWKFTLPVSAAENVALELPGKPTLTEFDPVPGRAER